MNFNVSRHNSLNSNLVNAGQRPNTPHDQRESLAAESARIKRESKSCEANQLRQTAGLPNLDPAQSPSESAFTSNDSTRSVSIYGFKGDPLVNISGPNAVHPYRLTCHVGYSFDGGETIYGFGPKLPDNMTSQQAVDRMVVHKETFPGIVSDDTAIFRDVSNNNNPNQRIYHQSLAVTPFQHVMMQSEHEFMGVGRSNEDVRYGFPQGGVRPPPEGAYNCATYPERLSINIPESSGRINRYLSALQAKGDGEWRPSNSS